GDHFGVRERLDRVQLFGSDGLEVSEVGSLVAPDRLRFDFSDFEAGAPEQRDAVEALANAEVITDAPVRHYETTKDHAESLGAIAFFGEKYGDLVRVLEAGEHSTELCGGTHVHALGFIGPIKIVSEGSIGANLRRIEAMTGDGAFEYIEFEEQLLRRAGDLLRAAPKEVPDRIERLTEQVRALQDEVRGLRAKEAASAAGDLAGRAEGGVLVARGAAADAIARPAAAELGGGVGRGAEAVVGGGQNVAGIEGALSVARELAAQWAE